MTKVTEESHSQEAIKAQTEGLATLLILNDEVRKVATPREFGFFVTNETYRLIPYHTAYLWGKNEFLGINLISQSGIPEIDPHTAASQWIRDVINSLQTRTDASKIHQISHNQVDSEEESFQSFSHAEEWPEELPFNLLWCPLLNKARYITGGLILFRENPFSESEIKMISWLIASYEYTWQVLVRPRDKSLWQKIKTKPYSILILIIILSILFFPIHLSILATGTVVPANPILVSAPFQTVIRDIFVNPGDFVKQGELLVTFDNTDLKAATDVAQKDLLLTEAKLRTAINVGFSNTDSSGDIPILQAQLIIDKAHYDYNQSLLSKTSIYSPINAVVVFTNKEDWVGQPVHTGERIMTLANPTKVSLKIDLGVSDLIQLKPGDQGEFFIYSQLRGIPIQLTILGYNARLLPNRVLAYQLMASFVNPLDQPQLGAQGTVRLYGERVPLIYYFIRRPLQALRHKFGI